MIATSKPPSWVPNRAPAVTETIVLGTMIDINTIEMITNSIGAAQIGASALVVLSQDCRDPSDVPTLINARAEVVAITKRIRKIGRDSCVGSVGEAMGLFIWLLRFKFTDHSVSQSVTRTQSSPIH